ncbi:hypothetical protein EB796_015236 [Bugula neritina]|uniref:Uncharacterized protein n=1 Tax=Bugula neritina TaxID=10212 RepID=A0A7J7JJF0_BUGNE|nr:hypothetical protein EB796_015236 [Bugula neritina]
MSLNNEDRVRIPLCGKLVTIDFWCSVTVLECDRDTAMVRRFISQQLYARESLQWKKDFWCSVTVLECDRDTAMVRRFISQQL